VTCAALLMLCANTAAMSAHRAKISRRVSHCAHAILVIGGAIVDARLATPGAF